MATVYATQSVTVPQILDAVALLARKALGWTAERVIEWHWDKRDNLDAGRSVVWYRVAGRTPDPESGAGRHGTRVRVLVEVRLVTRGFLDRSERDKRLQRAHWANQFLLENAFYGRVLHDLYEDRVGDEPPLPPTDGSAAVVSTCGTMVAADLPPPDRPRPEAGYLETAVAFEVPCVLKLSLADVPALDG